MRVDSEDRGQVVDRKAEARAASWANGARPTTKGGATLRRPQPTGVVHQSPRHSDVTSRFIPANWTGRCVAPP